MPRLKLPFAQNAHLDTEQTSAVCKFAKLELIKGICYHRMGLGKTRIALSLFTVRIKPKLPNICLFIARPSFLYDLKEEVQKIGLNAQIGTKENQWLFSTSRPTILFCSFANLQPLLDEWHWIKRNLRLVILDELYLYSNPNTRRSKTAREICMSNNAIGLSGTILPSRDNFAIWGQLRAISLESKVARNATDFRTQYQRGYKADFGGGECQLFSPKPGWEKSIFRKLDGHVSIRMPKVLNKTTEKISYVPLTPIQKKLIREIIDHMYMEHDGESFDFKYTIQTINRIRGILNGWIKTKNGNITYIPTLKLQVLWDQLAEINAAHEQCLVWSAFRADVTMLSSLCPIANLQMVGGKSFEIDRFKTDKYPIVFATLGSGASVNHFSKVPHAKFYSLGYKPLEYEQSKTRNDRRSSGGLHTANYTHIQCQKSLDEEIFKHVLGVIKTEEQFVKSFILWTKTQRQQISISDLALVN